MKIKMFYKNCGNSNLKIENCGNSNYFAFFVAIANSLVLAYYGENYSKSLKYFK